MSLGAAVVFLPLIASAIAGFGHRLIGAKAAQAITCLAVIAAAVCSVILFSRVALDHAVITQPLLTWITSGDFTMDWGIRIDTLTAVMLVVVTVVSAVVHLYSLGYMHEDQHISRFMSYLSLFTFAMLMLVTSDNLLQMFFGWEGVGLASYLLIGFWHHKNSANAAAMKAFIVNRVGDFGFELGIMLTFWITGSVQFEAIFAKLPDLADMQFIFWGHSFHALTLATFLLFIGAMGKSAQLGLHTWLPDAMEGPTPVSALIHAATMVTAGVFMVARLSPMFEAAPDTLAFVTILGALTALSAAFMALTQTDIKRVIAYSTMSQLGYMFMALGVGAYGAAVFHLMTHAFFKALLFLGAGSVIHALHHEQDMRHMGGVWKKIPITYAYMWIGNLALAGIPFFAGYYSKDMILEATYAAGPGIGQFAYWAGIVAAFMTAFYSWRLLWLTFHGTPRMDHHTFDHAHEAPKIMWMPLLILAAGALFAGWWGHDYFIGEDRFEFWGNSLVIGEHDIIHRAHEGPHWAAYLPTVMGVIGIVLGIFLYGRRRDIPGKIAHKFALLYRLSLHKFYIDELYNKLFVHPAWRLGSFFSGSDKQFIDGIGPDGVAAFSERTSRRFSRFQTGFIFNYASIMVAGVVLFLGFLLWTYWS
ncbi:MAG: NADH-quinone oxidoreductase subunit [Alphaproteobacteria bacterium]|nr:NADH-quinone oxidoreductase subunit [Alphaproteobacteria bacterium]